MVLDAASAFLNRLDRYIYLFRFGCVSYGLQPCKIDGLSHNVHFWFQVKTKSFKSSSNTSTDPHEAYPSLHIEPLRCTDRMMTCHRCSTLRSRHYCSYRQVAYALHRISIPPCTRSLILLRLLQRGEQPAGAQTAYLELRWRQCCCFHLILHFACFRTLLAPHFALGHFCLRRLRRIGPRRDLWAKWLCERIPGYDQLLRCKQRSGSTQQEDRTVCCRTTSRSQSPAWHRTAQARERQEMPGAGHVSAPALARRTLHPDTCLCYRNWLRHSRMSQCWSA